MRGQGQDQCARGAGRQAWIALALAVLALSTPEAALAHGAERGFVLLLPTGYYLIGGALAVAASFVLISFVPPAFIARAAQARLPLGAVPSINPAPTSLAAFFALCLLFAAGFLGSRDPLANPLPLAIWTLWWVGITLLHALIGNVWRFINPWIGVYRVLDWLSGGSLARAVLPYPSWLGYWPAILAFLGFAWLELVYPAPDDPERLAIAVGLYWLFAFAGMLAFGYEAWTDRAEPFSIFFRLVAGLAPLVLTPVAEGSDRRAIAVAIPGAALLNRDPLPLSGVLFVLLTLSSVSFDGLSRTFWWLGLGGINPLEFPGRSAVMERNTIGLILAFAALAACYWSAVRLGWIVAGMSGSLGRALGAFVYAIVPISIAFHFSHYLTALLVDGQYALIAASDPFGSGLDLLGLGHVHVTISFLNTYGGVTIIWNLQTAAIVLGHLAGIAMAHALALRHFGDNRGAVRSQLPLAAFMVLYTLFGLWLLSTPVFG